MSIDTAWIVDWHMDSNGNKVSVGVVGETHIVVDTMFYTNGIPDSFQKVTITSPAGMSEIKSNQTITSSTMYKVDYVNGRVQVHSSLEGSTCTVSYSSRGVLRINSNKIYLDSSPSLTLQDKITLLETNITTGDTNFTNHVSGTANKHGTNDITNNSTVTGSTATLALNALKSQMDTAVLTASNSSIGVFSMSGTGVNTITATYATLTYYSGLKVHLTTAGTNTASATLNINSIGVKNIKTKDRAGTKYSLLAGQMPAIADLEYDGTDFILLNGSLATYDTETTVTQPVTALASTVLEAPFSTNYLRGRTTSGYDANTKLLMYFEGTDGSTTFKDQTGKTVVASGNAQLDTAQKRWGTSSGFFDGTGDYLTVTDANSDLDLGTGDFTIECWVRFNALGVSQTVWTFNQSSDFEIAPCLYLYGPTNKLHCLINNVYVITSSITMVANLWHHIAIVKTSGYTKMYINGVQEGVSYADTNNYAAVSQIKIGIYWNNTQGLNGWIDELRISNSARYTSSFNPEGFNLISSDKMRVTSIGKNLFDRNNYKIFTQNPTGQILVDQNKISFITTLNTSTRHGYVAFISDGGLIGYQTISGTGNKIIQIDTGSQWRSITKLWFGLYGNSQDCFMEIPFRPSEGGYYTLSCNVISYALNLYEVGIDIQLERGVNATAYEPYKSTSAIVPVALNSVSDTVYDKFDCLTGEHTKNVSDVVTLSGNAYTWALENDYSGYKGVYAYSVFDVANKSASQVFGVKHNNKQLTQIGKGAFSGVDNMGTGSTSAVCYISVSDTDTGWDEAWTTGTSFTGMTWGGLIKAYMNGWKLTTANTNVASCVWTGIASGTVKNAGAADYTHVTTNIDVGFTPYRTYYQLANQVVTNYYSNVLNAYPSGTIITEPFVSDYDFYDGVSVVPHDLTRLIGTLAYVNIVNKLTGALSPVSLSTCTVSSLGTSFTCTALTSGDLIDYGYNVIGLSSQPSLTYKLALSLKATVDSLTNAIDYINDKIEQNDRKVSGFIRNIENNELKMLRNQSINIHMGGWRIG